MMSQREGYFDDRYVPTPVYARDRLQFEDRLNGPAIVEEFGSTTVIMPGQCARMDDFGNLVIERES